LRMLLSGLELHDPVPVSQPSAADRRKWKQVLRDAVQSVRRKKKTGNEGTGGEKRD
jgi:hypothetical protein